MRDPRSRYLSSCFLPLTLAVFAVAAIAEEPSKEEVRIALMLDEPARRHARPLPVPAPKLVAKAAFALDVNSGRIFYEKNADERREVASTQKLLTALVVCEAGNLDAPLTVLKEDTQVVPSKLYLRAGEKHPRITLLTTLLVKSANDVARCLARDNAGSVDAFVAKMNQRARQLGMKSSSFLTPNGLSQEGQYSTARDMARLARAAYQNPVIRRAVFTKQMQFKHNHGRVRTLRNTNRLLSTSPYCNGLKTGFTNAAGRCLISSGQSEGAEVIAVVLGSTRTSVLDDSRRLLHWALGVEEEKAKRTAKAKKKTG
jgi:D-alanyl-D-alanine carboxypeptidase (penicillin-binding protein 5/6)